MQLDDDVIVVHRSWGVLVRIYACESKHAMPPTPFVSWLRPAASKVVESIVWQALLATAKE